MSRNESRSSTEQHGVLGQVTKGPTYEEWYSDFKVVESAGGWPYCLDPSKADPGPVMPVKRPRPDGLGSWKTGREMGKPYKIEDVYIQAVWEQKLCAGFKHPQCLSGNRKQLTTWAALDLDAHENRLDENTINRMAKEAKKLLCEAGMEPRYICSSSLYEDGTSGGIHIFWILEQACSIEIAAAYIAHACELLLTMALENGITKIEMTPWEEGNRLSYTKKLSGFLRFPKSRHHKSGVLPGNTLYFGWRSHISASAEAGIDNERELLVVSKQDGTVSTFDMKMSSVDVGLDGLAVRGGGGAGGGKSH